MDIVVNHWSWWKRPDKVYENVGEINVEDEIITEQGYMSTQETVRRFMTAGIALQNFKREMFDKGVEEGV